MKVTPEQCLAVALILPSLATLVTEETHAYILDEHGAQELHFPQNVDLSVDKDQLHRVAAILGREITRLEKTRIAALIMERLTVEEFNRDCTCFVLAHFCFHVLNDIPAHDVRLDAPPAGHA